MIMMVVVVAMMQEKMITRLNKGNCSVTSLQAPYTS